MNQHNSVAIEASNLINSTPTGIPIYSKSLILSLTNSPELQSDLNISLLFSTSRWKKRNNCPVFPEIKRNWYIKNILFPNNFNLIHYTGTFHSHSKLIPKIITLYDLAVLKDNLQIPYYTSAETILKTRDCLKSIVKDINHIIFISKTTQHDFLEFYSFPEEKTSVTYLGPSLDPQLQTSPDNTSYLLNNQIHPGKFFLFVGSITVRKNILNLIKAFLSNKNITDYQLVLAGKPGMGSDKIYEEIKNTDIFNRIKMTGYLNKRDIGALYENAVGFVFPTYYEGFGIPIIDAMNFKIPVLIGNIGAAPEISQDFAIQADPFDSESISSGLEKLLLADKMHLENACKYANTFTWSRCAQQTANVYKKIL